MSNLNKSLYHLSQYTDPGEGLSFFNLESVEWSHTCSRSITDVQLVSPSADEVNRAVVRYTGDVVFRIYGIWWENDGNHRIDKFCFPQNHFYWASETGTIECSDFDDYFAIGIPSMTVYIDYEWREKITFVADYYNGFISPPLATQFSITANVFNEENDHQTTLRLYWDRSIYECIIWLNNKTMTHSCIESELELVESSCTKSAFAVGVATNDGSDFAIESISITDEDGNIQTMNKSACFGKEVIVDFSTVWGGSTINIYPLDLNSDSKCFDSSSYVVYSVCMVSLSMFLLVTYSRVQRTSPYQQLNVQLNNRRKIQQHLPLHRAVIPRVFHH